MKKDKIVFISVCAVMTLYAVVVGLWPLVFGITGGELGFCVMLYYIVFPLLALVCGAAGVSPKKPLRGLCIIVLAVVLALLMPWPTFRVFWPSTAVWGGSFAAIGVVFRLLLHLAFMRKKD